jgi:hypothetical protein
MAATELLIDSEILTGIGASALETKYRLSVTPKVSESTIKNSSSPESQTTDHSAHNR